MTTQFLFGCAICYNCFNADDRVCSTRCGHIFHQNCLLRWFGAQDPRAKNCPKCRKPSAESEIIRLFLEQVHTNEEGSFSEQVDTTEESGTDIDTDEDNGTDGDSTPSYSIGTTDDDFDINFREETDMDRQYEFIRDVQDAQQLHVDFLRARSMHYRIMSSMNAVEDRLAETLHQLNEMHDTVDNLESMVDSSPEFHGFI